MSVLVFVVGNSGSGKTTSIALSPTPIKTVKGIPVMPDKYEGLNPNNTIIINTDDKMLATPTEGIYADKWIEKTIGNRKPNVLKANGIEGIEKINKYFDNLFTATHIKNVVLDTYLKVMDDVEMSDEFRARTSGDDAYKKWADLAADMYKLTNRFNKLPDDVIVYVMAHPEIDKKGYKSIKVLGKRLQGIPERLSTVVVYAEKDDDEYFFETQANNSTGKSPMYMFDKLQIPNSLAYIEERVRKHKRIEL